MAGGKPPEAAVVQVVSEPELVLRLMSVAVVVELKLILFESSVESSSHGSMVETWERQSATESAFEGWGRACWAGERGGPAEPLGCVAFGQTDGPNPFKAGNPKLPFPPFLLHFPNDFILTRDNKNKK